VVVLDRQAILAGRPHRLPSVEEYVARSTRTRAAPDLSLDEVYEDLE
jgi:hypothetical protein